MDDFERALAEQSEQGSGMWFDIRAGRFTSSEMWKLMESGTREMTPAELKARPKSGKGSKVKYIEDPSCLSKTTQTYIRTKVAETLTGHAAEEINSAPTRWGDEFEPIAADFFREKTGLDYEIISFVPFGDHAGGSPDRVIKPITCHKCHGLGHIITDPKFEAPLNNPCNVCNGTGQLRKNEILEIKCPYNSANQIDYLMLTDQWDLMREYPEHYWQCMSNMLFMDSNICHFVTYDHRMKEDKNKMFYLPIKPISEHFDRITLKLETAIKEKLAVLQIMNNQKSTYEHFHRGITGV